METVSYTGATCQVEDDLTVDDSPTYQLLLTAVSIVDCTFYWEVAEGSIDSAIQVHDTDLTAEIYQCSDQVLPYKPQATQNENVLTLVVGANSIF